MHSMEYVREAFYRIYSPKNLNGLLIVANGPYRQQHLSIGICANTSAGATQKKRCRQRN